MIQATIGVFIGFLIGKIHSLDNSAALPDFDSKFTITPKSGYVEYREREGGCLKYDTFSFDFIKNDKLYNKIERIYGR